MNILDEKELAQAYLKIQLSPLSLDEESLSFYISQSRHDPRLAEIVTEHLRDYWWRYDSSSLNKKLKNQDFPNAILVMNEQVLTLTTSEESVNRSFSLWAKETEHGIEKPKNKELYFVNIAKEGSYLYKRMVDETISSYGKYNFIGRAILFNKQKPKSLLSKKDFIP